MQDQNIATKILWDLADRIAKGEIKGFAYVAERADGTLEMFYEFTDPRLGYYNVTKLRQLIDHRCGATDDVSDSLLDEETKFEFEN